MLGALVTIAAAIVAGTLAARAGLTSAARRPTPATGTPGSGP